MSMIKDSDISRFQSKILKTESCHFWQGTITEKGYGKFSAGNRTLRAHRVAYYIKNGSFNSALQVCHTCDNRNCVNPDHLFLGTNLDNVRDKMAKNRQSKPVRVEIANFINENFATDEILELFAKFLSFYVDIKKSLST